LKPGEIWTAAGGSGYAGKPSLADEDLIRLGRAIVVFLGLAGQ